MPTTIPVLSDHAYQSRRVEVMVTQDEKKVLSVGSWNLLDQGYAAKPPSGFSNNPYNVNESFETYAKRKRNQIEKIIASGDDLIFLQEIDFLTRRDTQRLKEELLQTLRNSGYECCLTQKPKNPQESQKPMAILYKKSRLTPTKLTLSKTLLAQATAKQKAIYRGAQTVFRLTGNNFLITATNLHLLYGRDYRQEIMDTLSTHQSHLHIMAGDTNTTMLNHLSPLPVTYATNFSHNKTTGELTNLHEDTRKQKTYDEFFIHSKSHHITVTNAPHNEYVVINKQGIPEFHTMRMPTAQSVPMQERHATRRPSAREVPAQHDSMPKRQLFFKDKKAYYPHYIRTNESKSGRWHLFQATDPDSTAKGDALKSRILSNFFKKLRSCNDILELEKTRNEIINDRKYHILEKSQGLFTWLAKGFIQTDSVRAFEKAYHDREKELQPRMTPTPRR